MLCLSTKCGDDSILIDWPVDTKTRIVEIERTTGGFVVRAQYDVNRSGKFYEQLLRERCVELTFENHRWPDLKRFEQYIDGVARDRVDVELADISGFNLLFPIPQCEVGVADLTQNPGCSGGT